MSEELIVELRRKVDEQHKEALYAIEVLSRYLSETPRAEMHESVRTAQRHAENNGRKKSYRCLVLNALREKPGSGIDDLVTATGLTKPRIRGVLYAPSLTGQIRRTEMTGGMMKYYFREEEE